MKTTRQMGIGSLPNTTEAPQISPEMAQMHERLKTLYTRATNALSMRRGRPGKGLLEEQEVARANLRAFERKNGLTS